MSETNNVAYTSFLKVGEADTAIAHGSGSLPVLATPRLVALMENAAMLAVAPSLAEGETTVGSLISVSHLSPSAVGAEVAATAVLEQTEGRKLVFRLSAREGEKLVGEGTHVRYIVGAERFMAKVQGL